MIDDVEAKVAARGSRVIPRGVKISILHAAAAAKYPREHLPTIAGNHSLTLDEVKSIVAAHGWPRPDSMRRAAAILEAQEHAASAPLDGTAADSLVQIPLGRLTPDPNNVRQDLGDLTELAESMVEVGLIQPVVARRHHNRLIVVSGHRRLAAAHKLHWTTIPCVIKPNMHADHVLATMLVENGQRAALDPIDEARALEHLKQRDNLSDLALAARIGRSQGHVSGRLRLLDLSPTQQAEVRAGLMTLGEGTRTGRKQGGSHRPAATGKKSAAHLTEHHPLAALVKQLCHDNGHNKHTPGRVGGIACGRCWEEIIRADERAKHTSAAP